jgi:hypothetical protein
MPHGLLANLEREGLIQQLKNNTNIYYLPETEIEDIADKMINFFGLDHKRKEELKKYLNILKETFDVDVVEPDDSIYLIFEKPQAIRNHGEWELRTEELMEDANELRIIAQTGEWITKYKENPCLQKFIKAGGKVELITCEKFTEAGMHSNRQEEIEAKLDDIFKDHIQIRYLPWGAISEHIKLNDRNKGMYMKRIAKSPIVAPIWMDNEKDCDLLRKMFDYYWNMSSS